MSRSHDTSPHTDRLHHHRERVNQLHARMAATADQIGAGDYADTQTAAPDDPPRESDRQSAGNRPPSPQ